MSRKQWWSELGEFWNQPASRSGRFHRPGQTQRGHALGVLALSFRMWSRFEDKIRMNRSLMRSFFRAALFHDVGKAMGEYKVHEALGAYWLFDHGDRVAAYLVLHHMGIFGMNRQSRLVIIQELELWDLDFLTMHRICDMLASCDFVEATCHNVKIFV